MLTVPKTTGLATYLTSILTDSVWEENVVKFHSFTVGREIHRKYLSLPISKNVVVSWPKPLAYLSWSFLNFPNIVDRISERIDAIWLPAKILNGPRPKGIPIVVSVHDLCVFWYPEYYSLKARIFSRILMSKSVAKADKIIAVSDSTRRDLIELFKIPEEKITVIHNGFNNMSSLRDNPQEIVNFRQREKIESPFILFVGEISLKKNILKIVDTFNILAKDFKDLKLILVGPPGFGYKRIRQYIEKCHMRDRIIIRGFVNNFEDVLRFYASAEVFIFLSNYEGFGFPVLEAMSQGCPVVASKTSSIPEVAGNAAALVSPHDSEEAAEAIKKLLLSENARKHLVFDGYKRCQEFSWKKSASKTYETIRTVCLK